MTEQLLRFIHLFPHSMIAFWVSVALSVVVAGATVYTGKHAVL